MSTLTPFITFPGDRQRERSPASAPPEQFRVISFGIGSYTFALPMGAITKVIHCPPLQTPGLGKTGLIHLEQDIIRILDLHTLIDAGAKRQGKPLSDRDISPEPLFLVVARRTNGDLCGVPVDTPPDLLEMTRSQVQPLPTAHNPDDVLAIARFIAVLPTQAQESQTASPVTESTILFLDLETVIAQLHRLTRPKS